MRLKLNGRNMVVIDDAGVRHWRTHLEHDTDPFVLAECPAGHTYVMPRQAFRWGEIPECPKCQASAERRAA